MSVVEWTAYLTAAKSALDIFKGIRAELPQGPKTEEAQHEIEKAEQALKTSEAELAKALGYKLCRCKFPPTPMLWQKEIRANVCPVCGDTFPPPQQGTEQRSGSWVTSRRGPNSWMGS
jgi:hypothetical protein